MIYVLFAIIYFVVVLLIISSCFEFEKEHFVDTLFKRILIFFIAPFILTFLLSKLIFWILQTFYYIIFDPRKLGH